MQISCVILMCVDPCIIVQFININPTRCNNVSEFYYSVFIWSSTCFGWHTAHHQEPKTALAPSGFSYMKGCLMCRWWSLSTIYTSPETCWASYEHEIIKFWYIVASCWIFLYLYMSDTYRCVDLTLIWGSESSYKNFKGLGIL
jgi:hypothetical protein